MREGWEMKKLGETCELINRGISPKYLDKGGLLVLNQKCVRNNKIDYGLGRLHDVNLKKVNKERLIQVGDVLVNSTGTGTLGRVAQVKDEIKATVDSHVTIVRPQKGLFYNEFFGYAMVSIEEEIAKGGEGCGGQTELSRTRLKEEYFINFPKSLSEQKRIVKILDNAFAAIDKAKANVEKNLQNAKDLFESYLQNLFTKEGDEWEERYLEEVVDSKCTLSYGIVQPGNDFINGLPIVRPTDLTQKFIQLDGLKLIDPSLANSYKRTILRGRELLLCVRGTTGTVSLSTEELEGANVTRGIVPVYFDEEILKLEFGYYLFMSPLVQKQIKEKTYGAALMQINIGDVRKIRMLVPSIKKQEEIIRILNTLSAKSKMLIDVYQHKKQRLQELHKSILEKAFSGELTAATKTLSI